MQVAFHIGAHCTDEDLLLSSLQMDADRLAEDGVIVPPPEAYRPVLRAAVRRHQDTPSDPQTEEAVLEAILDGKAGRRVVLSSENFICVPQKVFEGRDFYGKMQQKATWLSNVFPTQEVEFHIGLRDPATLVPALYARRKNLNDFKAFIDEIDVERLTWVPPVQALRAAVPDATITVWCNEDTPLIWPEVLAGVAGPSTAIAFQNEDAVLNEIMSPEGLVRMQEYLASHPPKTALQRRRIATAFLDKYALDEAMEVEAELPGWDETITDRLSERYETDLYAISTMENVTVILP